MCGRSAPARRALPCWARRAGAIGGLSLLLLSASAAGRAGGARVGAVAAAPAPVRGGRGEGPFWVTLLTLVSFGTAGAAAADRWLARGRREPAALRALRRLVAGSASAVGLASAADPRGWAPLAATAAAAGFVAESLVVTVRGRAANGPTPPAGGGAVSPGAAAGRISRRPGFRSPSAPRSPRPCGARWRR
jgi:hypothetical protein